MWFVAAATVASVCVLTPLYVLSNQHGLTMPMHALCNMQEPEPWKQTSPGTVSSHTTHQLTKVFVLFSGLLLQSCCGCVFIVVFVKASKHSSPLCQDGEEDPVGTLGGWLELHDPLLQKQLLWWFQTSMMSVIWFVVMTWWCIYISFQCYKSTACSQ